MTGATDDSKRAALLDAAARLLAEGGPDALRVRAVAAEVGASSMAVYTWFGSKANLVREVHREGFRRFEAKLRAVAETGDPVADLEGLGHAYRAHALADPNLYEVMFGRHGGELAMEGDDLALAQSTYDLLVLAVRRCVEAGALDVDPVSGARQLWAAVHGAVTLELAAPGPGNGDEGEFDALMKTMFRGLGGQAS